MENQDPLEMQNPAFNSQSLHLSKRPNCAFCGADLGYSSQLCPHCGAQAEHAPEQETVLYDDSVNARPYEELVKEPLMTRREEIIRNRLQPDHSKPIDKRKMIYGIIVIILALVVIGLLQKVGY